MRELRKPVLAKKWAKCPFCGKNIILYDDTANSSGIWAKCKKCGCEFEIKIQNGQQKTNKQKVK